MLSKVWKLDVRTRTTLVHLIGRQILGPNPSSESINYMVYEKWSDLIVAKWPHERRETYFCKYLDDGRKKPIGSLFNHVQNLRSRYLSLGVYSSGRNQRRASKASPFMSSKYSVREIPPSLLNNLENDTNAEYTAQMEFLQSKSSCGDENQCKEAWTTTSKKRLAAYKRDKDVQNIKPLDYVRLYPALQGSLANSLIDIDFSTAYPEAHVLHRTFPPLVSQLENALNKKNIREQFQTTLKPMFTSRSEDTRNLAGLLSIVNLVNTKNVAFGYRPSNHLQRRLFISIVPSLGLINKEIQELQDIKAPHKLTLQPFVIAIGTDYDSVRQYVAIVGDWQYHFEDVLSAVDFIFKFTRVLDLDYNPECSDIWHLLQVACYKISSGQKEERNHSVSRLLSEIQ